MAHEIDAKSRILDAAVGLLYTHPPERVTLEQVGKAARCAKGLVHYHYRTKDALLASAAQHVWTTRTAAWTHALALSSPADAIDAAWDLITNEVASGAHRAALHLATRKDDLIGRTARAAAAEFRNSMAAATEALAQRMGRRLTVPAEEVGELLVSAVNGLGLELDMGVERERVGAAWAAFWVGLLALTR